MSPPPPQRLRLPALAAQAVRTAQARLHQRFYGRLIFRWPRRSSSILLPALLLVAVLAHAVALYLFQIAYPPATVSPLPEAGVTLLTAETPEGAALLRWVEAKDPALAAGGRGMEPQDVARIRYTPAFANVHLFPRREELAAPPSAFPAAQKAEELLEAVAAHSWGNAGGGTNGPANGPVALPLSPEAPLRTVPTTLVFSAALQARQPGTLPPPLAMRARSRTLLRPTVFWVGVDAQGRVRSLFLQETSDEGRLDIEAEGILRRVRFAPAPALNGPDRLTWGTATFHWGTAAYDLTPAPEPSAEDF